MRQTRRRFVTAVAFDDLAGACGQPVVVRLSNALAVGVQHTDHERRVRRNLDHYRTIRLDHPVTDDFLHAVFGRDAEGGVVDVEHVIVGQRYGLDHPQKAGRPGLRARYRRIGHGIDVDDCGPVEIVHAADAQDRLILLGERTVELEVVRAVEDHGRLWPRIRRHDLGEHPAFLADHHGLLRVVARVVDPDAIERRRHDIAANGHRHDVVRVLDEDVFEVVLGAGHDHRLDLGRVGIEVPTGFDQPALRPAEQHAAGAILDGIHGIITAARRGNARRGHHVGDGRILLRRPGQHADVRGQRLGVLHVTRRVDIDHFAAALGIRERPDHGIDMVVPRLARLRELYGGPAGTGVMTLVAVEQLQVRAVRVDPVDVELLVHGPRCPSG